MKRFQDKHVMITGASAGIGEACALAFAAGGARLSLWARRGDRLTALAATLHAQHGVDVYTDTVDVRDRAAVTEGVERIVEAVSTPDVLVNNAGLASGFDWFHESDPEDWDRMIDTNLKGLLNVSRQVIPRMVARNRGHVINIGSVAGRMVYPRGNVYNATKFAVRAITQAMSVDLLGTMVRVSTVDPGACETEFSEVRFHGDRDRARTIYDGFQPLAAADVADAVCYVAAAPEHVTVSELVILPTAQRNPYALHREGTAK